MKKITSMLVAALLLSCEPEIDWTRFGGIAFSFNEEITVIEVDDNVTSFKLEGILNEDSNDPKSGYGDWPDQFLREMGGRIYIDSVQTTAEHGKHYIDKGPNNVFHKIGDGPNPNVYAHIRLIPENIKTQVEIVYYSVINYDSRSVDFGDGEGSKEVFVRPTEFMISAIDTTIIRLIPPKK